ncbi:MAG: hypothetical protein JWN44_2464 [Myxococcales bacterium]|nr:hypothetical protein [Myxococcales bacterium]
MKKLGLAALAALPLFAGCYAEAYPAGYYARSSYGAYGPSADVYVSSSPVYVSPRPVYVAPPAYYGRPGVVVTAPRAYGHYGRYGHYSRR